MRNYVTSSLFRKDYKRLSQSSRYKDFESRFLTLLPLLLSGERLPQRYKEHRLIGKFVGCHECHLAPDLLLIYRYGENCVELIRLGSHSDLF